MYSNTAVNISKEGRTQDGMLICDMVVQLQQPDVPKPTSRNSQKTVRRRQPALSGYLQGTITPWGCRDKRCIRRVHSDRFWYNKVWGMLTLSQHWQAHGRQHHISVARWLAAHPRQDRKCSSMTRHGEEVDLHVALSLVTRGDMLNGTKPLLALSDLLQQRPRKG